MQEGGFLLAILVDICISKQHGDFLTARPRATVMAVLNHLRSVRVDARVKIVRATLPPSFSPPQA